MKEKIKTSLYPCLLRGDYDKGTHCKIHSVWKEGLGQNVWIKLISWALDGKFSLKANNHLCHILICVSDCMKAMVSIEKINSEKEMAIIEEKWDSSLTKECIPVQNLVIHVFAKMGKIPQTYLDFEKSALHFLQECANISEFQNSEICEKIKIVLTPCHHIHNFDINLQEKIRKIWSEEGGPQVCIKISQWRLERKFIINKEKSEWNQISIEFYDFIQSIRDLTIENPYETYKSLKKAGWIGEILKNLEGPEILPGEFIEGILAILRILIEKKLGIQEIVKIFDSISLVKSFSHYILSTNWYVLYYISKFKFLIKFQVLNSNHPQNFSIKIFLKSTKC